MAIHLETADDSVGLMGRGLTDFSASSILTGAAISPPGAQFTVSGSVTEAFT